MHSSGSMGRVLSGGAESWVRFEAGRGLQLRRRGGTRRTRRATRWREQWRMYGAKCRRHAKHRWKSCIGIIWRGNRGQTGRNRVLDGRAEGSCWGGRRNASCRCMDTRFRLRGVHTTESRWAKCAVEDVVRHRPWLCDAHANNEVRGQCSASTTTTNNAKDSVVVS